MSQFLFIIPIFYAIYWVRTYRMHLQVGNIREKLMLSEKMCVCYLAEDGFGQRSDIVFGAHRSRFEFGQLCFFCGFGPVCGPCVEGISYAATMFHTLTLFFDIFSVHK